MIRRTLVLVFIAMVSASAVLGWRYRVRPAVGDASEALLVAHRTPGRRTARLLGLKREAAGFTLHSARAGRDNSRQLFFHQGRTVVSVFVSGQTVSALKPSPGWIPDPLRPGEPAWRYTDADGRTALAWRQNGHRCIATADKSIGSLTDLVRALTE